MMASCRADRTVIGGVQCMNDWTSRTMSAGQCVTASELWARYYQIRSASLPQLSITLHRGRRWSISHATRHVHWAPTHTHYTNSSIYHVNAHTASNPAGQVGAPEPFHGTEHDVPFRHTRVQSFFRYILKSCLKVTSIMFVNRCVNQYWTLTCTDVAQQMLFNFNEIIIFRTFSLMAPKSVPRRTSVIKLSRKRFEPAFWQYYRVLSLIKRKTFLAIIEMIKFRHDIRRSLGWEKAWAELRVSSPVSRQISRRPPAEKNFRLSHRWFC